jgi:hypothetical protein
LLFTPLIFSAITNQIRLHQKGFITNPKSKHKPTTWHSTLVHQHQQVEEVSHSVVQALVLLRLQPRHQRLVEVSLLVVEPRALQHLPLQPVVSLSVVLPLHQRRLLLIPILLLPLLLGLASVVLHRQLLVVVVIRRLHLLQVSEGYIVYLCWF